MVLIDQYFKASHQIRIPLCGWPAALAAPLPDKPNSRRDGEIPAGLILQRFLHEREPNRQGDLAASAPPT
ncbi:hypothetical protein D3C83_260820 [compost metagenome]